MVPWYGCKGCAVALQGPEWGLGTVEMEHGLDVPMGHSGTGHSWHGHDVPASLRPHGAQLEQPWCPHRHSKVRPWLIALWVTWWGFGPFAL